MRRAASLALIELLALTLALCLLVVVFFLLLPTPIRESNKIACVNNLAQLGKAVAMYQSPHYFAQAPVAGGKAASAPGGAASPDSMLQTVSPLIALRRSELIDNLGMLICPVGGAPAVADENATEAIPTYAAADNLTTWRTGNNNLAVINYLFSLTSKEGTRGNRILAADAAASDMHNPQAISAQGAPLPADKAFTPNHGDIAGPASATNPPLSGGSALFGDGHVESAAPATLLFKGATDQNNPWGSGSSTIGVSRPHTGDKRHAGSLAAHQNLIGAY